MSAVTADDAGTAAGSATADTHGAAGVGAADAGGAGAGGAIVAGSIATARGAGAPQLDVARLRRDFPALAQQVHGKPLVYLDNAATTQKPQAVLDTLLHAYTAQCGNIHRGVHHLSAQATAAFAAARERVRAFIHAPEAAEVIFVRGTTEAINLVAHSWGHAQVHAGDEVVITALEHHANIVPWQMLCAARGATLRVAPIDASGAVDLRAYRALLGPRTRMVAFSHVSNALGTVNPVAEMAAAAHAVGAVVLVDGAQAVPHAPVDVQALGCDFYAFSSHKVFGPTGTGVLWGRRALLDAMPPYQGGGDMIATVSFTETTYNELPHKFEAGTPDIAGAIGLAAAIDYVQAVGLPAIARHEADLLAYADDELRRIDGLRPIGTAPHRASVISFVLEDAHPHDVGTILDQQGIAIRTGHHCAQPLMAFYDVPATARASLAFYNTAAEVDALARGLRRVQRMFSGHAHA